MKKRLLPIIFVIAALYAAYYLGTQQAPAGDPVNTLESSVTVQPIASSIETATPKPTATAKPTSVTKSSPTYYIINKNTKVFHKPTCSSVNQMKESNKLISYKTADEIAAEGYKRCGRCHP